MADAKATEIYSNAYNRSPASVAFYEFTRTMQSYEDVISKKTTFVSSTESDLFRFLRRLESGVKR
jgi:membrane protease subunit HflC